MTSEDRKFLNQAEASWGRTLDYVNDPGRDAATCAIAVALWASVHVDRLIAISKATGQQP